MPKHFFESHFDGSPPYKGNENNLAALERVTLRPRILANCGERDLATTALGQPISFPVIIAPTGLQERWHADADFATARAAARAKTIYTVSTVSSYSVERVANEVDGPLWFQLYFLRDRALTRYLVDRASESHCRAIVVAVDNVTWRLSREREMKHGTTGDQTLANLAALNGPGLPTRSTLEEALEPNLGWSDIVWLRSITSLPIVIKGIQTREDAKICLDHGIEGIVVSNHGGHALDGGLGTADILPEVVDAVGDQVEVYLDGGIRSGGDVLKALALGARGVLIGRASIWGLAVAGEEGVFNVLEILRRELDGIAGLCGVRRVASASQSLVQTGRHLV